MGEGGSIINSNIKRPGSIFGAKVILYNLSTYGMWASASGVHQVPAYLSVPKSRLTSWGPSEMQ